MYFFHFGFLLWKTYFCIFSIFKTLEFKSVQFYTKISCTQTHCSFQAKRRPNVVFEMQLRRCFRKNTVCWYFFKYFICAVAYKTSFLPIFLLVSHEALKLNMEVGKNSKK